MESLRWGCCIHSGRVLRNKRKSRWNHITLSLSKPLTASRQHPNTSWIDQVSVSIKKTLEFLFFSPVKSIKKTIQHEQSCDFCLIARCMWAEGYKASPPWNKEERMWPTRAYQWVERTDALTVCWLLARESGQLMRITKALRVRTRVYQSFL